MSCHPILVAFVWELTKDTIDLPLGCLQGGFPEEPGLFAEQWIQVQTAPHSGGKQTILLRRASSSGAKATAKGWRSANVQPLLAALPGETHSKSAQSTRPGGNPGANGWFL